MCKMEKKLYIPNTQTWLQFYNNIANGKVNPYINHYKSSNQKGGGVGGNTTSFVSCILF